MPETIDPKEAKTLSDILALVLDEQSGSSAAALQKLRERAAQDRTTGGALKNLFVKLAGTSPGQESEELRSVIADQAAAIRTLQQQVRNARANLEYAQRREAHHVDDSGAGRRGALILGLGCAGAVTSLLAGVIGWRLGLRATAVPPRRVPATPPVAAPVGIVPPIRDPADTAPPPEYPPDAKARGEQGTVVLLVHVEADGRVGAIGVTQSAGADLDVATQQAVREWRFRPATRDGVPVAAEMLLRFTFVLHK